MVRPLCLLLSLFPALALAQADVLMNGTDDSETVQRVRVDSTGAVATRNPCATVVETVTSVGTTAVPVPATAQSSRKAIAICNSPENSGSPVAKCRADGVAPVMGTGTAGQALAKGDCITYSTSAVVQCIADTAATAVSASECR